MSYYEEDDNIYDDSEYEQYSDEEDDDEEEGEYHGGGFVAGRFKKGSKWTAKDYKKMGVKKASGKKRKTTKKVAKSRKHFAKLDSLINKMPYKRDGIPFVIAKLSNKALIKTIARVTARLAK